MKVKEGKTYKAIFSNAICGEGELIKINKIYSGRTCFEFDCVVLNSGEEKRGIPLSSAFSILFKNKGVDDE